MTTKIKQSNTKSSGIEWIGDIPSDWGVLPVRAILEERKEKNKDGNTDNILSVMKDVGVVRYEDKGNVGNKSSDRPESYKVVYGDDIVINSMNLVIGSVGLAKDAGVTSSVYIIYKKRREEDDVRYFFNLFRTKSFQRHLGTFGKGIMELRESIKAHDIKGQRIPAPPHDCQRRISDFLDEKTKTIDKIIKKKQKLIEILKEKRVAIITKAVTKGLDSEVKMKPSGVSWIGDIPQQWKMERLKFVLTLLNKKAKDYTGNKISLENIEGWTGEYIETTNIYSDLGVKFQSDDILFGKLRPYLGKVMLAKEAGDALGDVLVYRAVTEKIDPTFSFYAFISYRFIDGINSYTYGVKMPRANPLTIGSLPFAFPSEKEEQRLIVDKIEHDTRNINEFLRKTMSQISKLREYRASLIYNVVTGKIQV